ncbi:MAG: hypothetical protein H7330_08160 [Hymenobacteraceae bacterium]|nr:hypothetical protein [Hymenobacteraceae bacterium]
MVSCVRAVVAVARLRVSAAAVRSGGNSTDPPWTRDPVLSQVLVQQMATDRVGYCWVATDEGVFRYDGYELVPLRKLLRPGSPVPPEQHIRALVADGQGLLWVVADNKPLLRLDPVAGTLRETRLPILTETAQGLILFIIRAPGICGFWMAEETCLSLTPAGRTGRCFHPGS